MLRELAKLGLQMEALGLNQALAKELAAMDASTADIADVMAQCERVSSELNDLANQCSACENMQAMRKGLQNAKRSMLGDDFKDFDPKAVEAYLESQARLGQCSRQGNGGPGQGSGNGTGGQGQGRGGKPPESPTQTAFNDEKSPSQTSRGKILHELFVTGVPEKGEAIQEYADLLHAAREDAAGALARDKVPREYEEMVKRYFDALDTTTPRSSLFKGKSTDGAP